MTNEEAQRIRQLAETWGRPEMAAAAISQNLSLEVFAHRLQAIGPAPPPIVDSSNIGMSRNDVRQFSFAKLIRHLYEPGDVGYRDDARFELECSEAYAARAGRVARGAFVPPDVLNSYGRDLVVGTAGSGGNIVGTNLLGASFIELLRNSAPIFGRATVLGDLVGSVTIPKQTAAGTGTWVAEGSNVTRADMAFGQVAMSPKTIGAGMGMSRQLILQSTPTVEGIVRADLAKVFGVALDLAAINGTSTLNQPTGILNTAGIGTTTGGANGTAPTWALLVGLETALGTSNALVDPARCAYLMNAKTRGELKTTVKVASYPEYLWSADNPNAPVNGYPVMVTNNVPSNGTKGTSSGIISPLLFADWSELLFGLWGGLDIFADRATLAASGGLVLWAFQSADIAVRHAPAFAVIPDLT